MLIFIIIRLLLKRKTHPYPFGLLIAHTYTLSIIIFSNRIYTIPLCRVLQINRQTNETIHYMSHDVAP